jgi:hypothetical protein
LTKKAPYKGLPIAPEETAMTAESLSHVKQFLAADEGLALAKAFMRTQAIARQSG